MNRFCRGFLSPGQYATICRSRQTWRPSLPRAVCRSPTGRASTMIVKVCLRRVARH
jgi:hypothetical protein